MKMKFSRDTFSTLLQKCITYAISIPLWILPAYTQSVIKKIRVTDHRRDAALKTYQVFKIDTLKMSMSDQRFNRAENQEGVIGNDFFSEKKIGKAYANNFKTERSDYVPIDGYKRTLCGKIYEYHFYGDRGPNWDEGYLEHDDDLNLYIKTSNNPLINVHRSAIASFGGFFESNLDYVEGEIDLHKVVKAAYLAPYPIPLLHLNGQDTGQNVCLFGPWVVERGSLGKPNNHEIHPCEQTWWRDARDNSKYILQFAIDNSGRFNDVDDFDDDDGELTAVWAKDPADCIYAMPFEISLLNKEKLVFSIEGLSFKNVKTLQDDGKIHFLIYKKDTLAFVSESNYEELVNIDFVNVGYAPGTNNKTLRGFLIIKSRVDSPADYAGSVKLLVKKWKTTLNIRQRVVITFQSIKRLENNSYRGTNIATNNVMTAFSPGAVPNNFDEKKFTVDFRKGNQRIPITVNNLSIGQSYDLNGLTFTWDGLIVDSYSFYANCHTKYGVNDIPLGELAISGLPTSNREETKQTILHYEYRTANARVNDQGNSNPESQQNINDVYLFEIKYKLIHY